MAVTRLSQSSLREGLEKYTTALGNYVPTLGVLDNLQTVTVGAGGAASIDFTSIPNRFQHLHLRVLSRTTSASLQRMRLRFNNDSAANYSVHLLIADGGVGAAGVASIGQTIGSSNIASSTLANTFVYTVIDIMDFASTSKTKTVRAITGMDANTEGNVGLWSGAWFSTAAVTSLSLLWDAGNFTQHSTAALYGVVAR
jgi:hypothetical protein